jgi:hypothetical protein
MARTSGREITIDRVRVRVLPDGRLDRKNAALYLGLSQKTLAQWALQGRGPTPHKNKVSGRIFYYLDELDACLRDGDA